MEEVRLFTGDTLPQKGDFVYIPSFTMLWNNGATIYIKGGLAEVLKIKPDTQDNLREHLVVIKPDFALFETCTCPIKLNWESFLKKQQEGIQKTYKGERIELKLESEIDADFLYRYHGNKKFKDEDNWKPPSM